MKRDNDIYIIKDKNGHTIGAKIRYVDRYHYFSTKELKGDLAFNVKSLYPNLIINKYGFVKSKTGELPIQIMDKRTFSYIKAEDKLNVDEKIGQIVGGVDKNGNPLNLINREVHIQNGKSPFINFIVVLEDRGSAYKVYREILKYFAIVNDKSIFCNFISASGVGKIPLVLKYCRNNLQNFKDIIIIYDAINNKNSLEYLNIRTEVSKLNNIGQRCYIVEPVCAEEMCLSYKGLIMDIKNLSVLNRFIAKSIYQHYKGASFEYLDFDFISRTYKLNGRLVQWGYNSKYLKGNKVVNTKERYFTDKLLEMTKGNPYEFDKSASDCWFRICFLFNCKQKPLCNNTMYNDIKIESVLDNSLFGLFYDAISIISFGKSGNKVINNVEKTYLTICV